MLREALRGKSFPVDLLVILILILGLIAGTMIAGRRGARQADAQPRGAIPSQPERTVQAEQIGYREAVSMALDARPHGLAVAADGRIYVSAGFSIIELEPDHSEKRRMELDTAARCLAVLNGKLLLGCGDHVEVMDLKTAETSAWPSLGENAFITSIAAAGKTVMVGDAGNRRFVRYGMDGTIKPDVQETPQTKISISAEVPSTYFDVAAAPDGTFWAIEAGQFGVVQYDADGAILGRFGKGSSAIEDFGGCCNPTHLAVSPEGIIVTVEKKPDLVKTYRTDGTFRNVVAGPKAFAPKTFLTDVGAAPGGTVYILDPKQKALRIFQPKDKS